MLVFWSGIVVDRLTIKVKVGCHFDSCELVENKLHTFGL